MIEGRIREIHVNDYHNIYMLNQDFNSSLKLFSEGRVKEKIEIICSRTKDIIFVYEHNDEVLGYIHGSPYELLFSDSLINILGFVVKEEYRSMGIGSRLMDRLEEWARDNGYAGIKLLSHPSRKSAHRFYENRGYKFTKDQMNFVKNWTKE
ncbi:GNAT family N-acetyltransferase [Paenibacillus tarimensis]|uniref:GNAT family N-acetyltransferase n=1 Tax=Paenibacillus tarimensis TaxID=416012 RepID=UPI001F18EAE8|nr:GNAT family N-acetyltransferase [Paenibacillus tarimensis]MCF2946007.1 GNAT family N-acetyltransferase [Paenibacillus tarimensis]